MELPGDERAGLGGQQPLHSEQVDDGINAGHHIDYIELRIRLV